MQKQTSRIPWYESWVTMVKWKVPQCWGYWMGGHFAVTTWNSKQWSLSTQKKSAPEWPKTTPKTSENQSKNVKKAYNKGSSLCFKHGLPSTTDNTHDSVSSSNITHNTTAGLKGECYKDHYIYVAKRPDFWKNIITIYSESSRGLCWEVSCLPEESEYPGLEKSEWEIQITSLNSLICLRMPQLM